MKLTKRALLLSSICAVFATASLTPGDQPVPLAGKIAPVEPGVAIAETAAPLANDQSAEVTLQGYESAVIPEVAVATAAAVTAPLVGPPATGQAGATADEEQDVSPAGTSIPAAARAKMSGAVLRLAQLGGDGPAEIIVSYEEYPELFEAGRVEALGGEVVRRYESLDMLAVNLPADALVDLAVEDSVARLSLDDTVMNMGTERETAGYPVAASGNSFYSGSNVTVAVVDSGISIHSDLADTALQYSFVGGQVPAPTIVDGQVTSDNANGRGDKYGHGTHVAGIIAGDGTGDTDHTGLAGGVSLVSLKALDDKGQGSTSDVIAAIDWIATYGSYYDIRVVNLSLGQGVTESILTDPLVAAVDNLWDLGYVVVVAAGNYGNQGYATVMSPGNSRKVITVGSLTDSGTADPSDDYVSSFSSRGPTLGDMVLKPDLIAPGNRLIAAMGSQAKLKKDLPARVIPCDTAGCNDDYLELSGTSMAAPVVSSTVAMMLEKDPTLTPDTIKARLMRSATKIDAAPIEAGAGVLNIDGALNDTGVMTGPALSPLMQNDDVNGGVYIEDTSMLWGDEVWGSGYLWTNGYLWTDGPQANGYLWTDGPQANGYLWTDGVNASGYLWTDGPQANGYLWTDGPAANGYLWTDGPSAAGILQSPDGETVVLLDDPNPATAD